MLFRVLIITYIADKQYFKADYRNILHLLLVRVDASPSGTVVRACQKRQLPFYSSDGWANNLHWPAFGNLHYILFRPCYLKMNFFIPKGFLLFYDILSCRFSL